MQEKQEITTYSKEEVLANEVRVYKEHIKKLTNKIDELEHKLEIQYKRIDNLKNDLASMLMDLGG